jgi:hypothetical protein
VYFTHRLAKYSVFHIEKILNISWTPQNSPTSQSEWNTPCIQALSCGKFRLNTASRNIFI